MSEKKLTSARQVTSRGSSSVPSKKATQNVTQKVKKDKVIKTAPLKRSLKLKASENSRSSAKKIAIVSRVATSPEKKTEKKSARGVLKPTATSKLPALRQGFPLSIPSPFRFPIDTSLAAPLARRTGVFFVIVGAILTFMNIRTIDPQAIATVYPTFQSATTVLTNTTTLTQTVDCVDTTSSTYDQTYCQTAGTVTIDQTPDADIVVQSQYGDVLYGVAEVIVTVADATSVSLSAYHKDSGATVNLGVAYLHNTNIWKLLWNTQSYEPGDYEIKAVITNQYGTYTQKGQATYVVTHTDPNATAGTVDSTTASGASVPTTATTTNTTGVEGVTEVVSDTQVVNDIRVTFDQSMPLSDDVRVRIFTGNAQTVKLYLRNTTGGNDVFVGYAGFVDGDEWKYFLDTTKYDNSTYDLHIVAYTVSGIVDTHRSITIANELEEGEVIQSDTLQALDIEPPLTPEIEIKVLEDQPLDGRAYIFVRVAGAKSVELYAKPASSLAEQFIGLPQYIGDDTWRLSWDTQNIPNGSYTLAAKVRTLYGDSKGGQIAVSVLNEKEPVLSEEQVTYLKTIESSNDEAVMEEERLETDSSTKVIEYVNTVVDSDGDREEVQRLLTSFKERTSEIITEYARAYRSGDDEGMASALEELKRIKGELVAAVPVSPERSDVLNQIDAYLTDMIDSLRQFTERSEQIIKERIGEALTRDSDSDGITDYDEVNLYGTDAFNADTDSDGYTDGSEILSKYDPLDPSVEAYVRYESPKETGVVREDLLTITTIASLAEPENESSAALISGKALPNSFVNLYIFSTPIVMTVRADNAGNWSYVFDKELEDGEHEVYVGITDNAGRIVAKSNPFAFIKVAQAFSPVDAEENTAVTANAEPMLLSEKIMYLVASIAVVALGLVLILLGIHVSAPRPKELALQ